MLYRLGWRLLAGVSCVLGIIGAFLPVMPTVPFMLLAAWAASKGWPALNDWLLNHPRYGPDIQRWQDYGAVPRRAKWLASSMMLISYLLVLFSAAPFWLKIGLPVLFVVILTWLWLRPEAVAEDG